jgi:hypothetical protein
MDLPLLGRLAAVTTIVAAGALTVVAGPASAAALTPVAWSVSKPHPGDLAVQYTWTFTTTTAATISSVTFTVPPGTPTNTVLSVVDAFGVGAGSVAILGTTVTYTVTVPVPVASGVSVLISVGGFTNTPTDGTYASTVTTDDGGAVDFGNSNNVTISPNTTDIVVVVAQSTAFTLDTTNFALLMDPTVPALADRSRAVVLTVATNASLGYALNTSIDRQLTGAGHSDVLAAASAGQATVLGVGVIPVNSFGYGVSVAGGGVGTVQGAGFAGGRVAGYTIAGEDVVVATGPTNSDVITIANRASIDYEQPADEYTATVTYTVTPSY